MTQSIQAPDGAIVQFPDGMTDAQMSAAMQKAYPTQGAAIAPSAQPPSSPTDWRDTALGSPTGDFMHGAEDAMYGLNSLLWKGGQAASSLGGYAPNPVSKYMGDVASKTYQRMTDEDALYATEHQKTGIPESRIDRIAGNIVSPANIPFSLIEGPTAAATSIFQGAGYGAMSPTDPNDPNYWQHVAGNAAMGAAVNRGMHGLMSVAGSVLQPTYSAPTQQLLDADVPLTGGQILGGIAKRLEDAATSIPVVGDMIRNRQIDALEGFNKAAISRALDPIGEELPEDLSGHDAIAYAQSKLGSAYDDALSKMSYTHDPQAASDFSNFLSSAKQNYSLPDAQANRLQDIFDAQFGQKGAVPGGILNGDDLKGVQSELGRLGRGYLKDSSADQQSLGQAVMDMRDLFNQKLTAQNSAVAPDLDAANEGYANLVRVENAAKNTKAGMFTPQQLAVAVRQGGTRKTLASGDALMQDLSSAGSQVLPSSVPDSGTPLRHAIQLGGALLAGHMAAPGAAEAIGTPAATSLLSGAALYSEPAQDMLRAILTKRPYDAATGQKMAKALIEYSPVLGRGAYSWLMGAPGANAAANPAPQYP